MGERAGRSPLVVTMRSTKSAKRRDDISGGRAGRSPLVVIATRRTKSRQVGSGSINYFVFAFHGPKKKEKIIVWAGRRAVRRWS